MDYIMKLHLILILFVATLGIFLLIFSNQIVNPPNQPAHSPKNKRTSNFQPISPKSTFKRDRETYNSQGKSRKELTVQSAAIIKKIDDNQAEKKNDDQAEYDLELSTDFYEDTLAQQTEDSSISKSTLPEGVGARILIDGKYYDINSTMSH
jgi:hypothetical protein